MGRQRVTKDDPLVDDFEKFRTLHWSDYTTLSAELTYLLDDPAIAAALGRTKPPDRIHALKRLLNKWIKAISSEERREPPPHGRSLAFAAETLLRLGNQADATADELYEAIGSRWQVTRGKRKGAPLGSSYRTHVLAPTYASMAVSFRVYLASQQSADVTGTKSASAPQRKQEASHQSQQPHYDLSGYLARRLGRSPSPAMLRRLAHEIGIYDPRRLDRADLRFILDDWDQRIDEFTETFARLSGRKPFSNRDHFDDDSYAWLVYLLRAHHGVDARTVRAELARLLR